MNSAGDDRHTQGDRVPMNYRSPGHNPHYSPMDVAPQPTQGYPTSQPMPVPGASSSSSAHYSQQNFAHSPDESPPPQWEAIETTPPGSSKKVRAKPATDRTPGTTLVPTTRVETIVQAGGANNGLSKEAVYVLTVATEEFIKKLTTVSYVRADIEKRAITGYGDLIQWTNFLSSSS
ncbi:hypothetical protein SCHPADRAFT_324011 [Schizopora paradoxa]|uniref:Transcription factor CBF/NF-Y/archaeal histone domain-containing protein n=1 Tax=Schizopora paradoxa TaxID=27342 RepID=A0A0H2RQM6_9AGAM|nr:hypothetical protein SCHPADRAFT_324011 [Schizopora paradoxa]